MINELTEFTFHISNLNDVSVLSKDWSVSVFKLSTYMNLLHKKTLNEINYYLEIAIGIGAL